MKNSPTIRFIQLRHIRGLAIVVSILIAGVWYGVVAVSRSALPTYSGKTVDEWFFGDSGHPGLATTINDASVVFAAMGTNCVPYLLNQAQYRESFANKLLRRFYPSLPSWVQAKLRPPQPAFYVRMIAWSHLRDLAPSTLDHFDTELMAIVPKITDDDARWNAYSVVKRVAIRLDDVEKKKVYFSSLLDDPDFRIQLESAVMLSRIDSSLTNGISILLTAVTNRNLMDSSFPPPTMFPGKLKSSAPYRQQEAFEALGKVRPLLAERYRIDD